MCILLVVIVKPLQMRSRGHFSLILILISLSAAEQSCKKQNITFPRPVGGCCRKGLWIGCNSAAPADVQRAASLQGTWREPNRGLDVKEQQGLGNILGGRGSGSKS